MPITVYISEGHSVIQQHLAIADEYVSKGKEEAYRDIATRPYNIYVVNQEGEKLIRISEHSSNVATLKFATELGPRNIDLLKGLKILAGQFQFSAMWIIVASSIFLRHPNAGIAGQGIFNTVEQKKLIWRFISGQDPKDDHLRGNAYQDHFRVQWSTACAHAGFPDMPASQWWGFEQFKDGSRHPIPIDETTSLAIQTHCTSNMRHRQDALCIGHRTFLPFLKAEVTWEIRKTDGIRPVLLYKGGQIAFNCPDLLFQPTPEDRLYRTDELPSMLSPTLSCTSPNEPEPTPTPSSPSDMADLGLGWGLFSLWRAFMPYATEDSSSDKPVVSAAPKYP